MRTTALALSLLAATAGCTSQYSDINLNRARASSGLVGCAPAEIAISDNEVLTWTATCKDQKFFCKTGDGTACKKELE